MRRVSVMAPASSANLGPGFDVLGVALNVFYDIVEVSAEGDAVTLEAEGKYGSQVPLTPEKNTAGLVAKIFLERYKIEGGVRIKINKGVPPSSGLGSSGASAAGAAVALCELYGVDLSMDELVELAAQGEMASAGSPHADNVAPSICGGFTIVRKKKPFRVINLKPPENMEFALLFPKVEVTAKKTERARGILPKNVPLEDAVYNIGNSCGLVAGILLSNLELIGRCMEDKLAEPYRAATLPYYWSVRQRALEAGASGVAISGAGPCIIAIVDSLKVQAMKVAGEMLSALKEYGLDGESYVARPSEGARVLYVE